MSKKQKKQKQNNKLVLPLIILGGVLLIAAAFYFSNQARNGSGTPSIAVDQQKIDYGDVKFSINKSFAIKVTNTGDGILRFKEEPYIEVLEGC